MDIKEQTKTLERFLSQQGISVEFSIEMKSFSQGRNPSIEKLIERFNIIKIDFPAYFRCAFDWSKSYQGKTFWKYHDKCWQNFLKDLNKRSRQNFLENSNENTKRV